MSVRAYLWTGDGERMISGVLCVSCLACVSVIFFNFSFLFLPFLKAKENKGMQKMAMCVSCVSCLSSVCFENFFIFNSCVRSSTPDA